MAKHCFSLLLFLIPLFSQSQSTANFPMHRDVQSAYGSAIQRQQNFHSAVRPYLNRDMAPLADSVQKIDTKKPQLTSASDSSKKEFIYVGALADIETGFELNNETTYSAAGGLLANVGLGEKLAFSGYFLTGISKYRQYVNNYLDTWKVVPGINTAYALKNNYAYQQYGGHVSYSPNDIFNFQLGQGKNFFGDGYRSLFLSDVARNYPYLKISTKVWKIQYVNVYAAFRDVNVPSGIKEDFHKKYGTFHFLSWNIGKKFNVNLFESIIWQGTDTNRHRGYEINYLNPVIFYRPVEYSLGSSDNALFGGGFNWKFTKRNSLYGQIILDEFLLSAVMAPIRQKKDSTVQTGWWANKQGLQLGWKSFDLFGKEHLNFQTEFNVVRPFTYTHGSTLQNYGHFNQPLAHPYGANFWESVSFLNYAHQKWFFEAKLLRASYGADTSAVSYGQNIYKTYVLRDKEYGHTLGQGLKTDLTIFGFRTAYMLHAPLNLRVEAGFNLRVLETELGKASSPFIFLGIKTGLANFYDDF